MQTRSIHRSFIPTLLFVVAAAALVFPASALAQGTFKVEPSRAMQAKVEKPGVRMDARGIIGMFRSARIVYEGRDGTKGRLVAMLAAPGGEKFTTVKGQVFGLKPGRHKVGEHLPGRALARAMKRYFPDSVFFPDSFFFPDSVFFPDSFFNPRKAFSGKKLSSKRAGIIVFLVPAEGKHRSRGLGLTLKPDH